MRHPLTAVAVAACLLWACGDDDTGGGSVARVTVTDAWARATATGQTVGAVYFDIEVDGDDVLLGAAVPPEVAAAAEIHEEVAGDDGAMSMRELTDGLPLEDGETVSFEPGGLHVMLVELAAPLELGATFELTLDFAEADDAIVDVTVRETEP